MDGTTDSILMPNAYDLVWSIPLLLGVALVALAAVALVALVRVALAGTRALVATDALDEARIELVRERTARLRAGLADAAGGPAEPVG